MKIRLAMNSADVTAGVRGNCSRCPVAIALHRVLAALRLDSTGIMVGLSQVCRAQPGIIGVKHLVTIGHLPSAVRKWILLFDRENRDLLLPMDPLAPFELELDLPQEAVAAV